MTNELREIVGLCYCRLCGGRTQATYALTGFCTNCADGPFRMIFRQGDRVHQLDCPTCGVWRTVRVIGEHNPPPTSTGDGAEREVKE